MRRPCRRSPSLVRCAAQHLARAVRFDSNADSNADELWRTLANDYELTTAVNHGQAGRNADRPGIGPPADQRRAGAITAAGWVCAGDAKPRPIANGSPVVPVSALAVTPGDIDGSQAPKVEPGAYQVQVGSMTANFAITSGDNNNG